MAALRVTIIGSSDAFNSAGRFHSCYLIDGAGSAPIMVDFGATALSAVAKANRSPLELGALVFTHLHGDHIGGFPYLLIDQMFNRIRTEPLRIVGPVGTEAKLDALNRVVYGDVADRERPFEVHYEEIAPGESTEVLGATVRGFEASHMDPPERPLCLRIETPAGRSIAFSGDTEICDGLFAAAEGADLLIAECSAMRPPAGRHCTWQEWTEALPKVGAKRVVLSHLNAEVREAAPTLSVDGVDLAFADDGLIFEIE